MDSSIFIPHFLENLAMAERLHRLLDLYGQADAAVAEWLRHVPYHCPPGCGTCCSAFQPDILQVEAELVVSYVISARPGLLPLIAYPEQAVDRTSGACLFYSASYRGSCSVYPARPLICRLFGTTAVRDKSGEIVYRLCANIPAAGKRTFTARDLKETYPFCYHVTEFPSIPVRPGRNPQFIRLPLRPIIPSACWQSCPGTCCRHRRRRRTTMTTPGTLHREREPDTAACPCEGFRKPRQRKSAGR
jgi:Fe-S-cluster containining protein